MYQTVIPTIGRIAAGAGRMAVTRPEVVPAAVGAIVHGAEEAADTGNPLAALGAAGASFGGQMALGSLAGKFAPQLAKMGGLDPAKLTPVLTDIGQSIGAVGGSAVVGGAADYFANQGGMGQTNNPRHQFNMNRIARQLEQQNLNRRSIMNMQKMYEGLKPADAVQLGLGLNI